ncbi:glycosyl-4,4'-diaponeurosporenoate acyltransferase CrtO family protein [Emticicia agri]|uniref:Glycosyl-4,4'-diaponeurosporenoate acyltransferase n=1 Tax=Emticicia agri TaxID=2492393 RepID=A0A4Q5M2J1_9BACT|nr:hypothetical protein [Emticicia agri]RYU96325.1 hypothetical protein EWM59_07380 [Emticicia agri]
MTPTDRRIQQTAVLYNQLINFFWTILAFVPVVYFCYQYLPLRLLYVFGGISCIVIFIPVSWLNQIQLSQSSKVYARIGIRFIKKYTQDGDRVNQFIKKQHPQYKYIANKHDIKKLIGKSYMQEKFHYLIFIFFLCLTIYALMLGLIGWAVFIAIANIIYNLYPIFLQQYNRIRINYLLKRQAET